MEKKEIRVLALDLDGTLTNDQKVVTPATRTALDAAAAKGVTIVLASGRPTAGVVPLARELELDKKGGCILSYNGGSITDCATGRTLYSQWLDSKYVPALCAFAKEQKVAIVTYNEQGVVSESPEDPWALKECFTCGLPMQRVEDLAAYVDYPICKMLITLDPARRDEVLAAGRKVFEGRIDLYPSSPFFIEAVPLGVAKDVSLAGLLEEMGLFTVQTLCETKDMYLTRPDLGRRFSQETLAELQQRCKRNPDVQLVVSDGLSSTSVSANLRDILPAILQGLSSTGVSVGTPFFIKYGRVGAMDAVTEALGSKVTVILLGERPGLATGESMSAYMTYGGYVGIPEASRTVVSNIHRGGTNPAEAGAFIAELCGRMLKEKASGLALKL